MSSMVRRKLRSFIWSSLIRMLDLGLVGVDVVCEEILGGVQRTCEVTNLSSTCHQELFGGDKRIELSARNGTFHSVFVDCNSQLIAGGCDGGRELARPKSGSPKLRKRKRRRKGTITHGF